MISDSHGFVTITTYSRKKRVQNNLPTRH